MKTLYSILLTVFLLIAAPAMADTWKVNSQTVAITIPPNTSYTVRWMKWLGANPNSFTMTSLLGSGSGSGGTTVGTPANIGYNFGGTTHTAPFRVEFGYFDNTTQQFVRTAWENSYNYTANPAGDGMGGNYNGNNEATGPSGGPVDAAGNPTSPTQHKKNQSISNDTDYEERYRYRVKSVMILSNERTKINGMTISMAL